MKGLPFGISLNLEENDIAEACLRVKRCTSALFYSDVFADDELDGSGASLESVLKERNLSSFAESYTSIVNEDRLSNSKKIDLLTCSHNELLERNAVKGLEALVRVLIVLRK